MALMSDPIAVASSDPWAFTFSNYRSSVNVQVRFYTDLAGETEISPRGTGSRDLTATNIAPAYAGSQTNPTSVQKLTSDIFNGALAALPDGLWRELSLGGGLGQVTIVAAPNTTPPGALTYRIVVEAEGRSSAG